MAKDEQRLPAKSSRADVDAFLQKLASTPVVKAEGQRGRLIFGMDATASREPSWDRACQIQAEMFSETAALGGLDIQLCYYRGFHEFYSSGWLDSADKLLSQMTRTRCAGGMTQIARVLSHAIRESDRRRVNALVFVGDCMEEDVDRLVKLAGELGLRGVPVFLFHEGHEPIAEKTFREIARLSRGAYCRFDSGSAHELRDLLSAVAVFAAGGRRALDDFGRRKRGIVLRLTHQVSGAKR